jgi:2-dehydro-3-deoxyphosphogluconate aldolase / (4S)-4-hydroxy-2-oxoglutarate aldolase
MSAIEAVLRRAPVIPVLTVERAEDAAPLARALVAGGLPVLEVTMRTPAALEAMARIRAEVDGAVVGAGTVLTPADLDRAAAAGAAFAVSPGATEALLTAERPLPWLPGVATASELMRGLEAGMTAFKLFPAVPLGGTALLRAFAGPFPAARFCPTGGIGPDTAPAFLAEPNVLCVGGGWVAPARAVREGAWSEIERLARAAASLPPPALA